MSRGKQQFSQWDLHFQEIIIMGLGAFMTAATLVISWKAGVLSAGIINFVIVLGFAAVAAEVVSPWGKRNDECFWVGVMSGFAGAIPGTCTGLLLSLFLSPEVDLRYVVTTFILLGCLHVLFSARYMYMHNSYFK